MNELSDTLINYLRILYKYNDLFRNHSDTENDIDTLRFNYIYMIKELENNEEVMEYKEKYNIMLRKVSDIKVKSISQFIKKLENLNNADFYDLSKNSMYDYDRENFDFETLRNKEEEEYETLSKEELEDEDDNYIDLFSFKED